MLKYLAAIGNFSSYASELESDHKQRIASIKKQTLGHVVGQFIKNTFENADETEKESEELTQPRMSFNFL